MKKINIPQEKNAALQGAKKVMYAPNAAQKFEKFKYGSAVEEFASRIAVEEFEILQQESLEKIRKNISSPIEYFMYKNRMDLPTLASIAGFFQFRVKRHLKAKNFKKLSDKILNKYAAAFDVELKTLKEFSDE